MYFMPASLAVDTIFAASNLTGLKRGANCSYCARGIFAHDMIHSPISLDRLPLYSPAGTAYRPQWMNMPKRASRHHAMRESDAAPPAAGACVRAAAAAERIRTAVRRARFMQDSSWSAAGGSAPARYCLMVW